MSGLPLVEFNPMLLEMHCHTREHSSCSQVAAVDLVRRACALGLQGIVLTDHHYLWAAGELQSLKELAEVPKHFLVLSGQEVTTFDVGDVLVYGAGVTIKKGTPLSLIRQRFPQAAIVWAHPYRDGQHPAEDRLRNSLLDAVEIFNSNQSHYENLCGLHDWHHYQFTAISGTDTHDLAYAGSYPTLFDHPLQEVIELAKELRRGHCRPYFQELPRSGSNLQLTELAIGMAGADRPGLRLVVKELPDDAQWLRAERSFLIMEELHRHGFGEGRFRVPRALESHAAAHLLIEQGLGEASLFDSILLAAPATARQHLKLAAGWLAKLHGLRLQITPPEEFLLREEERLAEYLQAFTATGHRHSHRIQAIAEAILTLERHLYQHNIGRLVQGHGDYNPRNILLGQDNPHDARTCFVAAVDFDDSCCMPPAFDVGSMLVQMRNQFFTHPEALLHAPAELFLQHYQLAGGAVDGLFAAEVELFQARADLSIAYYLLKVGKGYSADIWRVIIDADRRLARLAVSGL
jgi:aminoglycoside phosphotransferase (APT) family kinase protein/predicted metal-dependent phosphoesterase TrpH